MMEQLATATFEEFLSSYRALWGLRVMVYVVLLTAVVRLAKVGGIGGGWVLKVGLIWLILGEVMECATRYELVELGYSPSYASIREEWEMGGPDWESWEPLFWWTRFALGWLGSIAAGVGFVLAGRRIAEKALRRDLAGGPSEL